MSMSTSDQPGRLPVADRKSPLPATMVQKVGKMDGPRMPEGTGPAMTRVPTTSAGSLGSSPATANEMNISREVKQLVTPICSSFPGKSGLKDGVSTPPPMLSLRTAPGSP